MRTSIRTATIVGLSLGLTLAPVAGVRAAVGPEPDAEPTDTESVSETAAPEGEDASNESRDPRVSTTPAELAEPAGSELAEPAGSELAVAVDGRADSGLDPEVEADLEGDTDIDGGEWEASTDDYLRLRDSPEAHRARRWVDSGIAATVVGGVLVGGAIAMGVSDPCAPNGGNNCFQDGRDRAAASIGIPGGVLLSGGVAMVVVGALQRRRLWTLSPALAGGRVGAVLSGRF